MTTPKGRWEHDHTKPSGFEDGFHRGFAIETREGFTQPICSCGWQGPMTSDEDVGLSAWTDHMEATDRASSHHTTSRDPQSPDVEGR